jgi:hypothetical protein
MDQFIVQDVILWCSIYDSLSLSFYRIGGVMVSEFSSSAVDRGFEPRSRPMEIL